MPGTGVEVELFTSATWAWVNGPAIRMKEADKTRRNENKSSRTENRITRMGPPDRGSTAVWEWTDGRWEIGPSVDWLVGCVFYMYDKGLSRVLFLNGSGDDRIVLVALCVCMFVRSRAS